MDKRAIADLALKAIEFANKGNFSLAHITQPERFSQVKPCIFVAVAGEETPDMLRGARILSKMSDREFGMLTKKIEDDTGVKVGDFLTTRKKMVIKFEGNAKEKSVTRKSASTRRHSNSEAVL
ncbi:MAG: hypothetical protein WCX97_01900 [Candidatus Magasanikbacteria bacterium]